MDKHATLESALGEASMALAYPPTPDLAPRLVAMIRALPAPARRPTWAWRRTGLAVALAAVALLASLLVPSVRQTVAGWLHIRGLSVVSVPRGGLASPTPIGSASPGDSRDDLDRILGLGGRTTLAEARAGVGFGVPLPAGLGEPDRVYLVTSALGREVSLLYLARPGLPPSTQPRVGLLLTVTEARVDSQFIQKWVDGDQSTIEVVRVRGVDGFWIRGHPHNVVLSLADGTYGPAPLRLAGNTLIWQAGDLTFRLESGLDRAGAIALANSLRP